jgi:hypothetical protein
LGPLNPKKQGSLVFVFCARTNLYERCRDQADKSVTPGLTIKEVVIESPWEFDVAIFCARKIPEDQKASVRIVVEGSPLFASFAGEVIDNSPGPEHRG